MNSIITELKSALEAVFTDYTVVYGEVLVPNDTLFPLIEVIPQTTLFNYNGTGQCSRNEFGVKIVYKNTLKKFVDNDTNISVIAHIQDAVNVMEERNATSGMPESNTILGVLLDNLKLNNKVDILQDFLIEYNINDYGESYVVQSSITFTAKAITPYN